MLRAEQLLAMPYSVHKTGYAVLQIPGHPCAWRNGNRIPTAIKRAHAVLWAEGRPVGPGQVVHHLDENKLNDDPSNLMVIGHGSHSRMHNTGNTYCAGRQISDETRAKLAAAKIGNQYGLGQKWDARRYEIHARTQRGVKRETFGCAICGKQGVSRRTHGRH